MPRLTKPKRKANDLLRQKTAENHNLITVICVMVGSGTFYTFRTS
jgi:hypothetical protein